MRLFARENRSVFFSFVFQCAYFSLAISAHTLNNFNSSDDQHFYFYCLLRNGLCIVDHQPPPRTVAQKIDDLLVILCIFFYSVMVMNLRFGSQIYRILALYCFYDVIYGFKCFVYKRTWQNVDEFHSMASPLKDFNLSIRKNITKILNSFRSIKSKFFRRYIIIFIHKKNAYTNIST